MDRYSNFRYFESLFITWVVKYVIYVYNKLFGINRKKIVSENMIRVLPTPPFSVLRVISGYFKPIANLANKKGRQR